MFVARNVIIAFVGLIATLAAADDASAGIFGRNRCRRYCPPRSCIATCAPTQTSVVVPSPISTRPRLQITEEIIVTRRLPNGKTVQETRVRTRSATTSEEVGILIERLQTLNVDVQKLDVDVFGNVRDRQIPLEQRVKNLEPPKPN